jgi:hypothetical protein
VILFKGSFGFLKQQQGQTIWAGTGNIYEVLRDSCWKKGGHKES